MLKKSISFIAAALFIFVFTSNNNVYAQDETVIDDKGITISPVRFIYDVDPGDTVSDEIKIINDTFSDKTIFLYTLNFVSDGVSGTPLFITEDRPYTASLKDWIKLDRTEVKVKKVERDNPNTERIKFTITVPNDAEPGGHYAGILATLVKPGENVDADLGNVAFKDERAAIVLINVSGEVDRSISADQFYATDAFTREKPLIRIFEWMPVGFVTELRNIGNSHTVPVGHILIFNGDEKIDQIDFNPAEGNILRDSSRTFFDKWTGALLELVPVLDENGNEVVDENGNVQSRFTINLEKPRIPLGRYTAKLAIGYDDGGDKKTLVQEFEFWVIPWKLILLIILLIAGYVYYRVKKNKDNKKSKKK